MKPEIDRRKLVGILVVVAFGIPILIELFTFSGIISNQILGHGNDASNSTDGTDPDVLTVGDEL
ncbi:MAG: hypothetical protein SV760_01120, partial [Halobacteria archaeon]|nr:hypothetical protein [Halobacteria archaeon]